MVMFFSVQISLEFLTVTGRRYLRFDKYGWRQKSAYMNDHGILCFRAAMVFLSRKRQHLRRNNAVE